MLIHEQVDTFLIEAVDLLKPVRVVIGHDERTPGEGWFLDKVIVSCPDRKSAGATDERYTFSCNRLVANDIDCNQ